MPSSSTDSHPERADAGPSGNGGKRYPLWANLLVSLVAAGLLLLIVEGIASVLLSMRAAKRDIYMREESHVRYDAELGWSNRPNLRIDDLYGAKTPFTTNAQGFRSTVDFGAIPPGQYRMIALGDSFTMGFGVGDDASYPAQMQAQCPALQSVNMGQGGYGLDQDYLWYKRDGAKLDTNLLMFALIAPDFFRMTRDDFIGYAKPTLAVRTGSLTVQNVPVPAKWSFRTLLRVPRVFVQNLAIVRIAQWLAWHVQGPPAEEFYGDVGDDVFAAAGLAMDDLAAISRSRGQAFALVYLPTRELLAREPTREAIWMEAYARGKGVPFINLAPDFERLSPAAIDRMFRVDSHYTDAGNRFVADKLLARLGESIRGFPECAGGGGKQVAPADSARP